MNQTRLLIFAKQPQLGFVKTRLQPLLGAQGCLLLHQCLIEHSLALAGLWEFGPVELWLAKNPADLESSSDNPGISIDLPDSVALRWQSGRDLGLRMQRAMLESLAVGDRSVLIGTDCPLMQFSDLQKAEQMLQVGVDVVVQPALDGGFVLIGCSGEIPDLSDGIDWGSGEVLKQLERKLEKAKLGYAKTRPLPDLDTNENYEQLQKDSSTFLSEFQAKFNRIKKELTG